MVITTYHREKEYERAGNDDSQYKMADQDEKANEVIDEEQEVGLDGPLLLLNCQVIIKTPNLHSQHIIEEEHYIDTNA